MARKGAWTWKRIGALYVLLRMWMFCPNQASSLQGCHRVSGASLAVENWGGGGMAQAGNRAGTTQCYLQWWDSGAECLAMTSAGCKVRNCVLIRSWPFTYDESSALGIRKS